MDRHVNRRLFGALARLLPRGGADFMPPGHIGWYSVGCRQGASEAGHVLGQTGNESHGGGRPEQDACISVQVVAEGLSWCMCNSQVSLFWFCWSKKVSCLK